MKGDKEQGDQRTGSGREEMTDGDVSRLEKYQYEKWMWGSGGEKLLMLEGV